ncbi:hypothetical protein R9C00_22180 [Flammeovirgaceae bacterium SG7u.111]|nr:hypothetical protein [Flammeovirgaceae bacterium SG7u.132]WPO34413.1 hypothetical protein R9C00_22180 [Flammeovirgaceae bacterium SG7u.111]
MDKLEKYITENLPAFDQHRPPKAVWAKIRKELDEDALIAFIEQNKQELETLSPNENLWKKIAEKLEDQQLGGWMENHRAELDQFSPSSSLWDKIDQELDSETPQKTAAKEVKMVPASLLWKVAASFLILLVSVSTFQYYLSQPTEDGAFQVPDEENSIAELVEAEQYYTSLIHQKQVIINNFDLENEELTEDFQQEIAELDSMYQLMKVEFEESQHNENVMSAMIGNLQLRIEILNQQLHILEKVKALENGQTQSINL